MKINSKIRFEDFFVYLNKSKTLIISDLQLGYEGDLIQSGIFVPANNYDNLMMTSPTPIMQINNNTKLVIEPLSEMLLLGTTIDYIEEDYSNDIYESKFIYTPQKDKATSCGCGISFSPK